MIIIWICGRLSIRFTNVLNMWFNDENNNNNFKWQCVVIKITSSVYLCNFVITACMVYALCDSYTFSWWKIVNVLKLPQANEKEKRQTGIRWVIESTHIVTIEHEYMYRPCRNTYTHTHIRTYRYSCKHAHTHSLN